jgi:DNA polymerase-3 subunit gamma/tau
MPETPAPDAPYRVLARAYRPTRLSQLIGQEALVRTLTNAFASGRIAHAFLLCGIRGVGKTTTARIIAAALNCTGADGTGGPTPEPCGQCPSCRAIRDGASLDVIEQDAASNTGKGEMIDLLEGTAYLPVASRYKVFILDEVHMLSDKAWASLLKTVEEPPPHVKFVFATTELRKVPMTVLSRCQRFDLRRVEAGVLAAHLGAIAAREGASAEPEALELIARAAEGSVRDALSLLDQAIAMSEEGVRAATVRAMLGLADQTRLIELFDRVTSGASAEVVERFAELHALGADPVAVLQDLLEISHWLSRLKVGADTGGTRFVATSAAMVKAMAERLSLGALSRAWQMLLRGIDEVRAAPDAAAAAEMILLRLACASELPPPAELMRLLQAPHGEPPVPLRAQADGGVPAGVHAAPVAAGGSAGPRAGGGSLALVRAAPKLEPEDAAEAGEPSSFPQLVDRLDRTGEKLLAAWLRQGGHLIRFEPGRLEFRAAPGLPADLANRLGTALHRMTGRRWVVALGKAEGEPTLAAQEDAQKAARLTELVADPRLRAVLDAFPGAAIVDVRATPASPGDPLPSKKEPAR